MAIAGAIADRLRSLLPITVDALSRDARIGDRSLQSAIDVAKANVTGSVVDPNLEGNYPVVVVDYIAKLAAIEIIPTGRDFWMNQSQSISSTGTNENLSYTDRAAILEDLRKDLIMETREKGPEISKLVNYWVDNGRAVPQMNTANINPFHLTPSPEEYPRPYKQTQYS